MQWVSNIKILGVFYGGTENLWLYFSNDLGVVGWREVIAQASAEASYVAAAVAAQYAAQKGRLLINNAGKICAIQTI